MLINYIAATLVSLIYIGTVDRVDKNIVTAELIGSNLEQPVEVDLHPMLFPCDIAEGDLFYIAVIDGVTEIRCGEPE